MQIKHTAGTRVPGGSFHHQPPTFSQGKKRTDSGILLPDSWTPSLPSFPSELRFFGCLDTAEPVGKCHWAAVRMAILLPWFINGWSVNVVVVWITRTPPSQEEAYSHWFVSCHVQLTSNTHLPSKWVFCTPLRSWFRFLLLGHHTPLRHLSHFPLISVSRRKQSTINWFHRSLHVESRLRYFIRNGCQVENG